MRPIKDKFYTFADSLLAVTDPIVMDDNQAAMELHQWAWIELLKLHDKIKEKASAL